MNYLHLGMFLSGIVIVVGVMWWLKKLVTTPSTQAAPASGTSTTPATSRPFEGIWTKHREHALSLAIITAALCLINWLCWHMDWQWWLVNWEHREFFYLSMVAVLIACFMLMSDHASAGAKFFATLVFGFVIAGWWTNVHRAPKIGLDEADHEVTELPSEDQPVFCRANRLSKPFVFADRLVDFPRNVDIIVVPLSGPKKVLRFNDASPATIDFDMSSWRVIQVQLPIDYVLHPRLRPSEQKSM